MEWLANQILAASGTRRLIDRQVFNPRPAGVIREGSATEAVLAFLRKSPRRYHRHHEIITGTNRSSKAVCFALIYLRELGYIETTPDAERNSRYLRYCLKPGAPSTPPPPA